MKTLLDASRKAPRSRGRAHPPARHSRRGRCAPGFSLLEVMAAVGIWAGISSMALMPLLVALIDNKDSIEDTMSTLVSENAVAVVTAKLSHSVIKNVVGTDFDPMKSAGVCWTYIGPADMAYPTARAPSTTPQGNYIKIGNLYYDPEEWIDVKGVAHPKARYGWRMMIRNVRPGGWQEGDPIPNDYEIVIIPFRKFLPDDIPWLPEITTDPQSGEVTGYGLQMLKKETGWSTSQPYEESGAIGYYMVRTSVAP